MPHLPLPHILSILEASRPHHESHLRLGVTPLNQRTSCSQSLVLDNSRTQQPLLILNTARRNPSWLQT